jgi:hypothetical protein
MTPNDVFDVVLRTLLNFQFIQHVDEEYERGNQKGRHLVDDFLRQKFPDAPSIQEHLLPLMNLKTALAMLSVPLCFAAKQPGEVWQNLGWEMRPVYSVVFESPRSSSSPTVQQILLTIRNAIAHVPDFLVDSGHPNVSWDDSCCVRFTARRPPASATFQTQEGFVSFLSHFIRYTRAAIRLQLEGSGQQRVH